MTSIRRWGWIGALAVAGLAHAAEEDALDLKPATPDEVRKPETRALRVFGELAAGRSSLRYGLPSEDTRRASLDFSWPFKISSQIRGALSNRLDDVHPVDSGDRSTLNSLREAYVGWQRADGALAFDVGRVNLRYGPAYGFNPTDFFRDGSIRAVTSPDPLALRENRLGTVMLRAQQIWDRVSLSLAWAPKLDDGPSRDSFSPDFGATNPAAKTLLTVGIQPAEKLSVQAFAYHERGKGAQLGLNANALVSDSVVGFAEWSGGKDAELLSQALEPTPRMVRRHRVALGATVTTASKLSVTGELEYNGFAPTKAQWNDAVQRLGIEALGGYLVQVQRRQDIASRRAAMLYLSQRDAGLKNLELTALVRYNIDDRSRFTWLEARYHWSRVDLALQWQSLNGRPTSEYGAVPDKRLVQLIGTFYF